MEIVAQVIRGILGAMNVWLVILMGWQLFLSIFGYSKNNKPYQDHAPKSRFLVLVPAHNEEAVIGGIIQNLSHMDYPRELYDFWILADNCTDRTAEVARSLGANVLEFFKDGPDAPTGKPIALQKALNALEGYQDNYDLVMFFDADNLMDPNMFAEVNSQYLDDGKADIIQCYLGAKNRKGVVALFYYMSYTITNRFFQFAKTRMGLNSIIGGTGFAVSAKYLHQRGGWTAMSLTEDFELQVAATCEGRRILWNQYVRIYDEKPTRFRASFRQRTRWAQGHWFVAFKNTGRLIRALIQKRISVLEFVSTFLYLYSLTPAVFIVMQMALNALLELFGRAGWIQHASVFTPQLLLSGVNVPGILIFFYSFVFLFYIGEWKDNHIPFRWNTLIPLLVSMLLNTIVASWAQVVGLAKHRQQSQWVKTEHRINDLQETTLSHLATDGDQTIKG